MAARYGGRSAAKREAIKPVPGQEKECLFLMTEILHLRKTGESKEWVIRSLGENFRLAATIYGICEKKPDANARRVLGLLLEQISF